jgi:hypothetical protein
MKDKLSYILGFVMAIWVVLIAFGMSSVSDILILREKIVDDYNGGSCLLVEYLVDGAMYNAVFLEGDKEEYNAFIHHLEQSGRIKRIEK